MVAKSKKTANTKQQVNRGRRSITIPQRYPRAVDDVVSITTHTLLTVSSLADIPYRRAGLVVLGKGTDAVGYTFLSSMSSLFAAMSSCYTRFMVTDLCVTARAPASTFASGGQYLVASYVPSDANAENPPTSEDEVAQARHMCVTTPGVMGSFRCKPSDYYGDWKNVNDPDDSDKQAGLVQYYGSTSAANAMISVIEIEVTVAFCGLRK